MELKHATFKGADDNRKWAVFLLNTSSLYLIYIVKYLKLVETISLKIYERPLPWHAKCSLPVLVRGLKTLPAQALYNKFIDYGSSRLTNNVTIKLLHRWSPVATGDCWNNKFTNILWTNLSTAWAEDCEKSSFNNIIPDNVSAVNEKSAQKSFPILMAKEATRSLLSANQSLL